MKFRTLFIQIVLAPYLIIFAQNGTVKSYYPNDTLKSVINFSKNIREGTAKFYFPNGNLKEEVTYKNGKIDGLVKVYSDSGKLKETYNLDDGKRDGPASIFKNGVYLTSMEYHEGMLVPKKPKPIGENKAIAKTKNAKEEKKTAEKIAAEKKRKVSNASPPPFIEEKNLSNDPAYYITAEIMPKPVGGMKELLSRVYYPAEARKNKITGVVKIKAFINQYGNVTSDTVVKGIGHGCDEAAKIAVFYAQFKPGIIKGQPVKVQMIIPIKFPPTDNNSSSKK